MSTEPRMERVAERKLRRRQLTDGNVEITALHPVSASRQRNHEYRANSGVSS